MSLKDLICGSATPERHSRRDLLLGAACLGATMVVASVASVTPVMAAQPTLRRVIVTLLDVDRESEIEDLFAALRRYTYKLVRVDQDSPIVILDVSNKTLRMLRTLDVVASIDFDELAPVEPEIPLDPFRISVRRDVDFDGAVQKIRAALTQIRHQVEQIDRGSRSMIVLMREVDIPMVSALRVVRSIVAYGPGEAGITPLPEGETPVKRIDTRTKTQRVIVQFNAAANRNAEIRRILRALQGVNHKVVTRFEVTPAIVVEVDARGLQRLQALPGIRLQRDSLSSPL